MSEERQAIRVAAEAAHELAHGLASIIRDSAVPTSHWDEVIEKLKEILGAES